MTVKIRAQYTKDTRIMNGLESIANEMMADPLARITAVVVIECAYTKVDHLNGGQRTLQANLASIEPVFDSDATEARNLLERAYKKRTGNPSAPVLFGDSDDEDEQDEQGDEGEQGDEEVAEPATAEAEQPWDEGAPRGNRGKTGKAELFSAPTEG